MHGIREPYRGGGQAALVGNPIFPKDKTGRAHHAVQALIPVGMGIANAARWLSTLKKVKDVSQAGKTFKNMTPNMITWDINNNRITEDRHEQIDYIFYKSHNYKDYIKEKTKRLGVNKNFSDHYGILLESGFG